MAAVSKPGRPARRLVVLAMTALALLWGGVAAAADDLVLGPGDKLSISVYRRPDLSGEFRVLPGGAVSLPFLGNVPVAGKTVEQVRDVVAQRLRDDAALLEPRVSVEIAEMQPILVAGPVRRPGQYPFQIGMTVGHALAVAGGLRRVASEEVGTQVEINRLREKLRQGQDGYGLALLRRARWQAEAIDAENFEAPAEAARFLTDERLQQSLASERQIMLTRALSFKSVLAMVSAQTAALNDEVAERQENVTTKESEAALLKKEAEYVDSLMQKGLTPRTSRVIELQRLTVQVDGERRQILSQMARARQEIIRLGHERENAVTQRQLEYHTGIKDAEDQMASLRVAMEEARAGLAQLNEALPSDEPLGGARAAATVVILRNRSAPPQRIEADADRPLLPGDLVDFSGGRGGANRNVALGTPG